MYKVAFILGAAVFITAAFVAADFMKNNTVNNPNGTVHIKGAELLVEVADEDSERARGLSGREKLIQNTGMLFIFQEPTVPHFWMKDMHFPIDIIWIGSDKQVIGIEHSVTPTTFPQTFSPPEPILYVLEANAGWAQKNNIIIGERVEIQTQQ